MRLWMELILNSTREADKIRTHTHTHTGLGKFCMSITYKKKIQRKVVEFHKIAATLDLFIIPAGLCSK